MKKFNPHFNKIATVELMNARNINLVKHIGIEYTEIGEDYIIAKMPVDKRTQQPFGYLHGGASVVLAETLGSVASFLIVAKEDKAAVGLEINANHARPVSSGFVYGKVTPLHLGKRTHIWDIQITDEEENLVCVSRLTTAIIDKKK